MAYLVAAVAAEERHTAVVGAPVHVSNLNPLRHPEFPSTYLAVSILLWWRRRLPILSSVVVVLRLSVTLLGRSSDCQRPRVLLNPIRIPLTEHHSPAGAADSPGEAARHIAAGVAGRRSCCGIAVQDSTTWWWS
jgi:hypothetical protein